MISKYEYLMGFRLISDDNICIKIRARRHKKKRIDKKWLKRYGYKYVPDKSVYIYGDMIIGHPSVIDAIIEKAKERCLI